MGQRIGYARVSSDDQNLDLQLDTLYRAGIAYDRLYFDTTSGKDAERKEFQACLKALHEGDTLVVWRLDRLGRLCLRPRRRPNRRAVWRIQNNHLQSSPPQRPSYPTSIGCDWEKVT